MKTLLKNNCSASVLIRIKKLLQTQRVFRVSSTIYGVPNVV